MLVEIFNGPVDDYRNYYLLAIDGVEQMDFVDGESEDNSINRNFSGILNIGSLLSLVLSVPQGEKVDIKEYNDVNRDDLPEKYQ